jgi:hypothetical protein
MSFLDRIKSLFSGSSQSDDDRAHQLQTPTQPEPTARQPTEEEIAAAAAAAPLVAPVDPHAHVEPGLESADVPRHEGSNGRNEGEPLDEREDAAS